MGTFTKITVYTIFIIFFSMVGDRSMPGIGALVGALAGYALVNILNTIITSHLEIHEKLYEIHKSIKKEEAPTSFE